MAIALDMDWISGCEPDFVANRQYLPFDDRGQHTCNRRPGIFITYFV
jgi:hypothetical protein